ncbi:MAG: VWA domain-containing protein [Bacteroidota bacterium]
MENRFSYKTNRIIAGILFWEIAFWIVFAGILFSLGYFSSTFNKGQLGFKFEEKLNYLALLIPLIISVIWFIYWKNKKLAQLGSINTLKSIIKPINSTRFFLTFFFFRNALVFTIITMAQPVFGTKKVSGTLETMELVLSIDVSNSMNTRDIESQTSRLEIVKRAMIQLMNNLHGEKIGISIFAGGAYLQLPITADYEAAKMYINEIETNMVSNQGTNVAAALEISKQMFSKEKTSKAILLVTDGENHEGGIDAPIEALKTDNIMLAVLGIGTKSGGFVPNDPYKPELGYKTDARGSKVVSRMNENFIHELAQKSGGFSLISASPYPDLSNVLDKFSQLKRTKVDSIELDIKENWYQIPLFFALISWLIFAFLKQGIFLKRK